MDGATRPRARVVDELQLDFALNQPLSPFALAVFELLDRESPTYALDVLSVIESTLDDPRQILAAQQNKARGEAVGQMKADGVEYEERMERLQDVTYPKPLSDLLDAAYELYRRGHPWVADYELSPKSVARDMVDPLPIPVMHATLKANPSGQKEPIFRRWLWRGSCGGHSWPACWAIGMCVRTAAGRSTPRWRPPCAAC